MLTAQGFSIVSVRCGLWPRQCRFVIGQSYHSVFLTHIFGLTWCLGERLPPDCLYAFSFAVYVLYVVACVLFVHRWGIESLFMFLFLHTRQRCIFNRQFRAKCHPPQFQEEYGYFLCVLDLVTLRFVAYTTVSFVSHSWDSPTAVTPLALRWHSTDTPLTLRWDLL